MKAVHLALAAALAAGSGAALAQRMPVPIVNHENVVVARAPGQPPMTVEEVKKAIIAGAGAGARKWTVAEPEPGRLLATYQVRTHTVITDIRYTATQFSVSYADSVNMKHAPGPDGKGVIHPFYNQWVTELIQSIRNEMARS